jgi:hypothetical protein
VGVIALSFPHVLGNGFGVTSDLISLDYDEGGNMDLGNSFPVNLDMASGITSLLIFISSIMLLNIIEIIKIRRLVIPDAMSRFTGKLFPRSILPPSS